MPVMVTFDPQKLAAQHQKIVDEIARLQKEADEIEIALRVVERFSEKEKIADRQAEIVAEMLPAGGTARPAATPTNFEMLEEVLASAEKDGRDGLTASEVVDAIRQRFWPGLVGPQILPSIYRFAKEERIKKTANGKFKRLKKQGAEAASGNSVQ
jgi:hypothetical protein